MKKTFLVTVALVAITAAFAQRPTTHFGVKAGLNLSTLEIENSVDGDHLLGFHVGGLAHIHISRRFALQPELMYSSQGREQTISGVDYKTKLSYINIPVLGQYMTGGGLRLQTGPQLGFLLNAENEVNDVETDVTESYKTVDVSWIFGASYLTNSGLGFDARFNLGLSNINDVSANEIKNRVWQFGLFYQFMHNPAHRRR